MAKEYHEVTAKNPFAGGRKPIWPTHIMGKGNITTISIPRLIKVPTHEMAKIYAQFAVGNITREEALEQIAEIFF